MSENDQGVTFSYWFGAKDPSAIESEWQELKVKYSPGDKVTGTVIAKSVFGAWIDFQGFPTLLEIICIEGLTPERYQAGDWCPIGSQVTGFIGDFRDDDHQIRIYQVLPGRSKKDRQSNSPEGDS